MRQQEFEELEFSVKGFNLRNELYNIQREIEAVVEEFDSDISEMEEPQKITIAGVITIISIAKAILSVLPEIRDLFTNKKTGEYEKPKIWKFPKLVKVLGILLLTFIKEKFFA